VDGVGDAKANAKATTSAIARQMAARMNGSESFWSMNFFGPQGKS
jgi:hypothetical protein